MARCGKCDALMRVASLPELPGIHLLGCLGLGCDQSIALIREACLFDQGLQSESSPVDEEMRQRLAEHFDLPLSGPEQFGPQDSYPDVSPRR